ncbi:farnesol dehydrogenase-like [Neocloeon triangulifer]|uniref:farnesol dehydrogenase-like n=1 Tax=Neocloeon triangulifer TaxID=2078957 RepID=UPI00286F16CA|nr:farnesol dehydrogenase-like [Neocloeon triangulifer]
MDRWLGRVAVVSGASSGIGRAITKKLALRGLRVVGVSRRPHRVQSLSTELKSKGASGEVFSIHGDVTKEDDISKIVKWTKSSLGSVDVLVNNAGVFYQSPLRTLSTEKIRHLFDVNVVSLSVFTRQVLNEMMVNGIDDGHIINMNGIAGNRILDFQSGIHMYSATKHAVRVLSEGLRRELRDAGSNIRITAINPGVVRTDLYEACGMTPEQVAKMFAEHQAIEPEDVADAVEYALSVPPHVQIHDVTVQPVGQKP